MSNLEGIAKRQHELLVKLEKVETVLRDILTMKNNVIAEYSRHASETRNAVGANNSDASVLASSGGSDLPNMRQSSECLEDDGASLHASGAFYKQFLPKEAAVA